MNPTNEQELRELAHIIMNADTPYDAMQFVKDHTNAEIAKVLDRLEAQWGETIDNTLGKPIRIKFVSVDAIQAERAKIKGA
jgi:hypothetical protein